MRSLALGDVLNEGLWLGSVIVVPGVLPFGPLEFSTFEKWRDEAQANIWNA